MPAFSVVPAMFSLLTLSGLNPLTRAALTASRPASQLPGIGLLEPYDALRRCALRISAGATVASSFGQRGARTDGRSAALVAERRAPLAGVNVEVVLTGSVGEMEYE
jgi:hypothetical protein